MPMVSPICFASSSVKCVSLDMLVPFISLISHPCEVWAQVWPRVPAISRQGRLVMAYEPAGAPANTATELLGRGPRPGRFDRGVGIEPGLDQLDEAEIRDDHA